MKHELDHRNEDHRFATRRQRFIVFAQPATLAEPAKRTFDNPTFRQHHELARIGALDDFDDATEPLLGDVHKLAGIAAVGPDQFEPFESAGHFHQDIFAAVTILNVCAMDDRDQNHTECIDSNMPFSAGDFLACVVSVRPPFRGAAVLIDCESITAALGVGFLPAWRRTFSRSLS